MGFNRSHPNEQSWKGKFVLRILSLILITAALIACAYSWRLSRLVLPVIVMSWLWQFANIVKRLSSEYPMHPGANVAVDLIIWLLFIILGGVNLVFSAFARLVTGTTFKQNASFSNYWGNATVCTTGTTMNDDDEPVTTTTCNVDGAQLDLIHTLARASMIGIGFAFIVALFHFILFIWACVDTHRYRRERKMAVEAFRAKQNEFSTEG